MERRFLLALMLTVAVWIAWMAWFGGKSAPKSTPDPAAPSSAAAAADSAPPAAPANPASPLNPAAPPVSPAPAAPPAAPAPAPPADGPRPPPQSAKREVFELTPTSGEFLGVGFTSRGGAITHVTLRNAYETSARDVPAGGVRRPLDFIVPVDEDRLSGMVILGDRDDEQMETLDWTVESRTETQVVFTFLTTTSLRIRKTFAVPTERDRFDLDVSVAVERVGVGGSAGERAPLWLLGVAGVMREPEIGSAMSPRGTDSGVALYVQVVGVHDEPAEGSWSMHRLALDSVQTETRSFRLAGVGTGYFLASVWSPGGAAAPLVRAVEIEGGDAPSRGARVSASFDRLVQWYASRGRVAASEPALSNRLRDAARVFPRAWVKFDAPVSARGAAPATSQFQMYVGPLSRRVLGQDRYSATLGPLITYPAAPDFLAKFLLFIFDLWRGVTGSAGVAILLMTVCVRGGLMPLSIRNQLSMRRHGKKLARIKPKLDALRERFGGNPKKFREEQGKLMKEHGIGFPMGCLMMFLQIPIFFSLFSSLRVEYDIRHASFLWIKDLAGPDRIVDFGRNLLSFLPIGIPPGGFNSINLLPIVYIALTIWQQHLMPPPTDPQQAQSMKMAKWMSIVFSILLYNYTAALALYMCVSSLVALIESRIVRARDRAESAAA